MFQEHGQDFFNDGLCGQQKQHSQGSKLLHYINNNFPMLTGDFHPINVK